MKKVLGPIVAVAMFVAGYVAVACSKDSEKSAPSQEKLVAEFEKLENEFETLIEEYKDVDPDFDVKCEYSGIVNRVRGHKDSPVLYREYDSAEVHIEGYMYYADDTPMELQKVSEDKIEIQLGNDVYWMDDIKQDGATLTFKMNVRGMEAGFYSVESQYFAEGDVMKLLGGNTKLPVAPIVYAALKYVVIPFCVGVAASMAANSCSNDNNASAQEKCREDHKTMALDCQSRGGQPISKHNNCPNDCFYTCKQ